MKKTVIAALFALVSANVFAQKTVDFDLLTHLGFGVNIVSSDDTDARAGGNFFVNIVEVNFFPQNQFGVDVALDFSSNSISARDDAFVLDDDNKVQVVNYDLYAKDADYRSSSLFIPSLSLPVLAKARVNAFEFGLGAEANLQFRGSAIKDWEYGNKEYHVTERKAKTNRFTYDLVAKASWNSFGLYVKYYPSSVHFLPEGSVDYSMWTVGLSLGF